MRGWAELRQGQCLAAQFAHAVPRLAPLLCATAEAFAQAVEPSRLVLSRSFAPSRSGPQLGRAFGAVYVSVVLMKVSVFSSGFGLS